MRFLFLGDIVGKPGYTAVLQHAQNLRESMRLDALVCNGENASDGSGMTNRQYKRLIEAGVDVITMGDHIYRQWEISKTLQASKRIVKPANYPDESPGRTWTTIETESGETLAVVSLLGRVFMKPVDCPFAAVDRVLSEIESEFQGRIKNILVDIHAEATSDKQLIGRYLDGRVSAVLGTHTHVPTADTTIFSGGTAFQCDVGMSGPYDSVIGRDIRRVMTTTRTFEPTHFYVAKGDVRLCGAMVETDEQGHATKIERFEKSVDST